jgi:hypothetical protein
MDQDTTEEIKEYHKYNLCDKAGTGEKRQELPPEQ